MRVKEEMYSVGGTLAHEIVWIVYACFKFNLGSDAASWFSIDANKYYLLYFNRDVISNLHGVLGF